MLDNPQLVFGHFRVAAQPDGSPVELGRGAMGVTYKAFDERLRIDVALKLITPAQIDNPKAQSSFLREARAAARVHHSNVASVVFLNDTPGNFFYAMEFVEGQPLRDWMQAHPTLPPLTIIGLALQIAHGLEAIHEQHLVHRDLKPTNIMMVRTSRTGAGPSSESDPSIWKVKIIDFGLARVVSPGPGAATQTAGFHGTALYASPEQCEERVDLDGRSDLYSLGCIMWEMLCGAPPFHARTHRELLNQHVSEPLPMDRLAHAPPSLAAVVARLLIKDPDNRFPDALALIKALERCREKLESGEEVAEDQAPTTIDPARFFSPEKARAASTSRAGDPLSTASGSRRDLWIVGVAVLALVVPVLIFLIRRPGNPPPVVVPAATAASAKPTAAPLRVKSLQKSIAVLPFENLSSSKDNEFFADGVQEDVLTNLTKIRDLRVVSRTSVQRYRNAQNRNLREIGRDLGVDAVLEGSVRREENRVVVTARLVDVENEQNLWSETYDKELTDSFAIQSQIAKSIANSLQTNVSPAELSELSTPTITNAKAYPLYIKARGLMSDFSERRNLEAAVGVLNSAIEADPNFALAQAWLSMLHTTLYDWSDHSPERLALALKSGEAALRLQPSLPEGQLAMAMYYGRGLRDYEQATPYFQRVLAARPNDAEANYELACMQRREGKWVEAAEKFERLAVLNPYDDKKQYQAANTYAFMRRYDDAWRVLGKALSRMPDSPPLKVLKGNLFLAWKNDFEPMRMDLATRPATVPDEDLYLFDKIQFLLLERKFDEALAVLRNSQIDVIEGQAEYTTREGLEAEILVQAGRTQEAREIGKRLCRKLAPLVAARPNEMRIRMAYALALAATGEDAAEARRQAALVTRIVPVTKDAMDGPFFLVGQALVFLRTDGLDEAREIVDRVRKNPSIYYDSMFNLSPAWDALRATKPQT
jgi:serine/threonine protein kinase